MHTLKDLHPQIAFGLYRDDGLAVSRNMNGHALDRARKDIINIFKNIGLKITIDTNLKRVDFLDVSLDLDTGLHKPYRKPTEKLTYIHRQSCHPFSTFKNLVGNISKRISDLSSNVEIFNSAAPYYNNALRAGGHPDNIEYVGPTTTATRNSGSINARKRKRKIIWFAPPFSLNVQSNIGRTFLRLVDKHFPINHRYRKMFNRNTLKTSFSTMPNMKAKLNKTPKIVTEAPCNCRSPQDCPLDKLCNTSAIVYEAEVKPKTPSSDTQVTAKKYIGMTAGSFKLRYRNHLSTFRYPDKKHTTRLSSHVWSLRERGVEFDVLWKILQKNRPYVKGNKICSVCIGAKCCILKHTHSSNVYLNTRSEIFKGCLHARKHLLVSWEPPMTP